MTLPALRRPVHTTKTSVSSASRTVPLRSSVTSVRSTAVGLTSLYNEVLLYFHAVGFHLRTRIGNSLYSYIVTRFPRTSTRFLIRGLPYLSKSFLRAQGSEELYLFSHPLPVRSCFTMPRNCMICSKLTSDSSSNVSCAGCKRYFHPVCVNLTNKELEFLKESKGKWCCPACTSGERLLRSNSSGSRAVSPSSITTSLSVSDPSDTALTVKHFNLMMEQVRNITSTLERVERRQDDILTRLDNCTATIKIHSATLEQHQSQIDSCESELVTLKETQNELSQNISTITEQILNLRPHQSPPTTSSEMIVPEVLDRMKRSYNLVISNVPVSDEPSDLASISAIVDHIKPSSSQHISNVTRLPAKDSTRPPWVRVTFSNPEIVQTILRNKVSLVGNPRFRTIKIQDDKTKGQISHLNILREELKRRQDAGEKNLTIKYIKQVPTIVTTSPVSTKRSSKN